MWFAGRYGGSVVKDLPASAGVAGSILGQEDGSPGGRNGNLLQYSCLKNPVDRGAWRATVPGVAKSRNMTEGPSTHHICALCFNHFEVRAIMFRLYRRKTDEIQRK